MVGESVLHVCQCVYTDRQGTPNGQRSKAIRRARHIHTSMQTPTCMPVDRHHTRCRSTTRIADKSHVQHKCVLCRAHVRTERTVRVTVRRMLPPGLLYATCLAFSKLGQTRVFLTDQKKAGFSLASLHLIRSNKRWQPLGTSTRFLRSSSSFSCRANTRKVQTPRLCLRRNSRQCFASSVVSTTMWSRPTAAFDTAASNSASMAPRSPSRPWIPCNGCDKA